MKTQTLGATLREIIGGTPAEVFAKLTAAAVTLVWANLNIIGMAVFAYFLLLVIDAVMGAILSVRGGKPFSVRHFTLGPLKKFGLTAAMLFASALVDSMIPGNLLFYGVSAFVTVSALIDVAKKYGALTGSKVVQWIENKLGDWVKT